MENSKVDKTKSGKDVNHGLPSSYNNHRCRCEECTSAWAKYIHERGYVKKSRAKKKKTPKPHTQIKSDF